MNIIRLTGTTWTISYDWDLAGRIILKRRHSSQYCKLQDGTAIAAISFLYLIHRLPPVRINVLCRGNNIAVWIKRQDGL